MLITFTTSGVDVYYLHFILYTEGVMRIKSTTVSYVHFNVPILIIYVYLNMYTKYIIKMIRQCMFILSTFLF